MESVLESLLESALDFKLWNLFGIKLNPTEKFQMECANDEQGLMKRLAR